MTSARKGVFICSADVYRFYFSIRFLLYPFLSMVTGSSHSYRMWCGRTMVTLFDFFTQDFTPDLVVI